MSLTIGKLEARIRLDEDVDVEAEDDGGPFVATIPAGDYYLSSPGDGSRGFIEELEVQFTASGADAWTVAIDAGETGSGRVTISADGSTAEVTWGNIDAERLRDLLGFSGQQTGSTSYESSAQARPLWLPGRGAAPQHRNAPPNWIGWEEANVNVIEGPSGIVQATDLGGRTINALRWAGVARPRVWAANEGVEHESFQRFWRDVYRGEAPYVSVRAPIRWYWDADDDEHHATYRATELQTFNPEPLAQHYVGHWTIETGRLVLAPDIAPSVE